MLILEIAAGVCLGILACPALWLLSREIIHWYRGQRWWWGDKKYRRMVEDLSRRYSRHLLVQAGVDLRWTADALQIYEPIDGGEEKFDPVAMAKIEAFGRRVDAMR